MAELEKSEIIEANSDRIGLLMEYNKLWRQGDTLPAIKVCYKFLEIQSKKFDKLLQVESNDLLPYFCHNEILTNSGNINSCQVIECYRKTLEIEPGFSWAWHNLGLAYANVLFLGITLQLIKSNDW